MKISGIVRLLLPLALQLSSFNSYLRVASGAHGPNTVRVRINIIIT